MKWGSQKGMALPMVLALMFVFIALLAGLLPLVANTVRNSSRDYKWVSARYAAEAAAKYALLQIQNIIDTGSEPTATNCSTIASTLNSSANSVISSDSESQLSCTCTPKSATITTASGGTTTRRWIEIRATGSLGGRTAIAKVNYYLQGSPIYDNAGVVDYIATGNYSHTDHNPNSGKDKESRWTITEGDDDTADTADASGVSQVMFSNPAQGDTINVTYRASAGRNDQPVSGGGFGIYYGAIGNADNMNAYVLQYDPGAQKDYSRKYSSGDYYAAYGTLLVKKVVFEPDTYVDNIDSSDFKTNTGTSPGEKEVNQWNYTATTTVGSGWNKKTVTNNYYYSGTQSDYYALPFQSAYSEETLRIPLASSDDSENSLQAIMQKNGGTFDIDAPHSFTIKTEFRDGRLWHLIYCDNNTEPVLKFFDHSQNLTGSDSTVNSSNYRLNSFKGTQTGLRVWSDQVDVGFTNVITEDSTDRVEKAIIWLK